MAKYIVKRILTAIPLIIVITILCFSLMHLAPYDAIDAMTTPKMSPEMVQMIREKYGYDQPVYVQYIRWLEGILNGNFGYSIVTKTNIFDELAIRIPNTIKLVLPSYLTAYVIAIVLGLLAGSHKNKWQDKLIDGICSLWIAMPTFWVAMLFIYLFFDIFQCDTTHTAYGIGKIFLNDIFRNANRLKDLRTLIRLDR